MCNLDSRNDFDLKVTKTNFSDFPEYSTARPSCSLLSDKMNLQTLSHYQKADKELYVGVTLFIHKFF